MIKASIPAISGLESRHFQLAEVIPNRGKGGQNSITLCNSIVQVHGMIKASIQAISRLVSSHFQLAEVIPN